MANLTWRLADAKDIEQIKVLVNEAYRGESGWTNESQILSGKRVNEEFLSRFFLEGSPNKVILVFTLPENVDELIGTVCLEKENDGASLGMFSVSPSLQNKGYGRRILELADEFVRTSWPELERIEMGVITQRTELIAWYERRGFQRTGKIIPFPYDDPSVGTPLIKDMTLSILEKRLN